MNNLENLRGLASGSLIAYAIWQWDGYTAAKHHHRIAEALERVESGKCKRLMIMMPPRHGKSKLVSEFFVAWYMGKRPENQVMHATYGQELADGFGRSVRNLMNSDVHKVVFPESELAPDSQAAARFHTTKGGVYHAVGVGGALTGRGADLLIIDDPIKGREDAESELSRQKMKDWYTSVAYTRLMPGGAIVVVQTRWHEDDLAGWMLEQHKHEGWEVISMPALDKEDTVALWPEAYPVERLLQIKQTIGPRDWEALYQQRPTAAGGGEFKRMWMQYYSTIDLKSLAPIILVDPASGKRKTNDYTTMWVIGLGHDENYYVIDMVRDRLNLTERAEMLFRLHRKYRPVQVRYERYGMMADIEYIRQEMDRRSYRFAVTEVGGATAKEDRIRRLVPLFERGRFWFPTSITYTGDDGKTVDLVDAFINEELLSFPVSRHDDMLDALARIAEPSLDTPWPRKRDSKPAVDMEFRPLDAEMGY